MAVLAAALAAGTMTGSSSSGASSRWIAFHADPGGSGDLYVDSEDGSRRRLTRLFGQVPTASWSPDGARFALLARPR